MQYSIQRATLGIFALYVALIPGSALLVAFDRVPAWGLGFGSVLLLVQGAAMLTWLSWRYGIRGTIAGLVVAALGFAIEFVGETTGFPFGRYHYTELVQPQLFGAVPLAICAAWMMAAASAYEIALRLALPRWGVGGMLLLAATLVLILDLQIETVAALTNNYWVWQDSGPYYGVPTANFVAWWLVGLGMAWVLWRLLGQHAGARSTGRSGIKETWVDWLMRRMPAALYLLSTGMFVVINVARGFILAGLVGAAVLLVALALTNAAREFVPRQAARRQYD